MMIIVAGLSLKNLKPRVWDPQSEWYLPELRAVMVSYADLHAMPARREAAMEQGIRRYLGVPRHVKVYLDNGAFYFAKRGLETPYQEYEEFKQAASPDWYPIPYDFIPSPAMSSGVQRRRFERTMDVNSHFSYDGFVPVAHVGRMLDDFVDAISEDAKLAEKRDLALGGIVPNLLRAPKALAYDEVLDGLTHFRDEFPRKRIHVFGMGGTATVHLAALLRFNSLDSSGWRNRAARGLVQLPGRGDRMITNLGNWRGRRPDKEETGILRRCRCPACKLHGMRGVRAGGIDGFCHRATHNLWVLLQESAWVDRHIRAETYLRNYRRRLDNTVYLPLIETVAKRRFARKRSR